MFTDWEVLVVVIVGVCTMRTANGEGVLWQAKFIHDLGHLCMHGRKEAHTQQTMSILAAVHDSQRRKGDTKWSGREGVTKSGLAPYDHHKDCH